MDPAFSVNINQRDKVTEINIPEGNEKPYTINGHFYIRIGANSQQLNRDEIRKFFQREGQLTFDTKINSEFEIDDNFNEKAFEKFITRAKISDVISRNTLLKNLGFMDNGKMNNSGVLFFSKNITKFMLNATITYIL